MKPISAYRRTTARSVADGWRLAAWLLAFLVSAQSHAGESPFLLEISPEQPAPTVGEPLVIQVSVTNIGSEVQNHVAVSVDGFRLTWYFDFLAEGCEILISVSEPLPGGSSAFGFFWDVGDLEPGESKNCRVTFPRTLSSGTETIHYFLRSVSPEYVIWERGEFTYTLLPVHSEVPVELEAGVEQSPQQVGEPLVLNLAATNISGEALAPFVVVSHQLFHVAGREDFSTDGCDVAAVPVPADPPGFGLDWFVPDLPPGETATCRVTFPNTPSPGTETISFFALIEGAAWEELAEITYAVLAGSPAVPIPVNAPAWLALGALLMLLLAARRLCLRRD